MKHSSISPVFGVSQFEMLHKSGHVMDLDNLLGTTSPTPDQVKQLATAYEAEAKYLHGDLSIFATNHFSASVTAFEWPFSGQLFVKSGNDGADKVLAEHLDDLIRAQGITRIVIGSGDHYFLDSVRYAQKLGMKVHVVAKYGTLSPALQLAANSYSFLPNLKKRVAA